MTAQNRADLVAFLESLTDESPPPTIPDLAIPGPANCAEGGSGAGWQPADRLPIGPGEPRSPGDFQRSVDEASPTTNSNKR